MVHVDQGQDVGDDGVLPVALAFAQGVDSKDMKSDQADESGPSEPRPNRELIFETSHGLQGWDVNELVGPAVGVDQLVARMSNELLSSLFLSNRLFCGWFQNLLVI